MPNRLIVFALYAMKRPSVRGIFVFRLSLDRIPIVFELIELFAADR